jgi:sterol desaturase/sphingolipid hydroxylase (fatty acid hydroxylase superfamily)
VHHGSDLIYLDRNYAGILIVWDRMALGFSELLKEPMLPEWTWPGG